MFYLKILKGILTKNRVPHPTITSALVPTRELIVTGT